MMFSEVGFLGCIFLLFLQKEATKPAIAKKENGIDIIESAPQEQTNNDNCNVDGAHKNNTSGKLATVNVLYCLNDSMDKCKVCTFNYGIHSFEILFFALSSKVSPNYQLPLLANASIL